MPIIPIIPSVNTCMTLTSTNTTTTTSANTMAVPEVNTTQLQLFADVCSTVTSAPENVPAPIMNSLVSATKVITNDSLPNPMAAAVTNMSIPTTIPISSIPVPIMSIKAVEGVENDVATQGLIDKTKSESSEDSTDIKGKPLEEDAIIENDLEQKKLDESSEKRKSSSSEIPLVEDEEFKSKEEIDGEEKEDSEVKMLDLEENEVKMVDASEMTDGDEVVVNRVRINVEDEDVKVDEVFSSANPSGGTCAEPMECGSNLTSPKHVMKTHFDDVMMSETTSVSVSGM